MALKVTGEMGRGRTVMVMVVVVATVRFGQDLTQLEDFWRLIWLP
jgi:hypothetical protein